MGKPLAVKHAQNMRELGGYQTKDGQKVASHKLIRSAAIHLLDEQDQAYLADYGLKKIVDFRSREERVTQPDQPVTTAENIFLPIFPEEDKKDQEAVSASPQTMFERLEKGNSAFDQMIDVYENFVVNDAVRQQYRQFFEIILANENQKESVLFHCTAGKDRTGFGAMLLLTALGVDRKTVMADYLETNQNLSNFVADMQQKAKESGASEKVIKGMGDMMGARPEYLDRSFAMIQQHYGDVENFLLEGIGVTNNELKDLRKLYLA